MFYATINFNSWVVRIDKRLWITVHFIMLKKKYFLCALLGSLLLGRLSAHLLGRIEGRPLWWFWVGFCFVWFPYVVAVFIYVFYVVGKRAGKRYWEMEDFLENKLFWWSLVITILSLDYLIFFYYM
jgi:hypothetical protein